MRFTESHEWIQSDGSVGTVGISDFAQKELGEIVHVQLPKVGQKVTSGEEIAVLESTKAAADVYAPASGKVIAVNESLQSDAGAINRSAESAGWLFRMHLDNPYACDLLMTRAEYHALIAK